MNKLINNSFVNGNGIYEKTIANMRAVKFIGSVLSDIRRLDVMERLEERKEFTVKKTFPFNGKPYLREEVLAGLMED